MRRCTIGNNLDNPRKSGVGNQWTAKLVVMKRIGLLGGMSWESSVLYEELINTEVRTRLGGTNSADLIVRSYNFADIEALQQQSDWKAAGALLAEDAKMLADAGAEVIALCTNTMHIVADTVADATDATFVHLIDETATAIRADDHHTVGLLGTRFTMEMDFYRERLESNGLTVLTPNEEDRTTVHDVIYNELVQGELNRESRENYLDIIDRLGSSGAQGIIAGCTEIELLVSADDIFLPYYPTTEIHASAIVDAALA